jgi:acetyltransferase
MTGGVGAPVQAAEPPAPARDAAISQAGEQRSARVESLRAVGALSVAAFHVYAVTTGAELAGRAAAGEDVEVNAFGHAMFGLAWCGFSLLIALSGVLLFWPFVRQHWGGGDRLDLRRYAKNRFLRIVPLYYVVLLTLLLIQEDGGTKVQWTHFMTMTENFSTVTAGHLNTPMWSVVVEVHFYILLPFLAWGLARLAGGSVRRAALLLLGIGAASLALRYSQVLLPERANPLWRFSLPTTFWFFVPGMVAAFLRLSWQRDRPSWLSGQLANSDLWLLASVPFVVAVSANSDLDPLGGIAAFFVVGACVLPLTLGPVTRAISWRPLAFVGVASYSLYMWHAPVIRLVKSVDGAPDTFLPLLLVSLPLAILVSLLSYRVIEAPFLGLRKQWARSSAPQESPRDRAPEAAAEARP